MHLIGKTIVLTGANNHTGRYLTAPKIEKR